ncbi:hypothetical protein MJO28_010016 [Puccinia striiformis f. sp. tritici]|uniref:Uncharacterized protein n=1 Tax=Puccinia striiformis f. sp. tritici TaxID=168172 RepID=A0ACC0E9D8_9BASI|nr:hypothetical protein MJO28_010016 [Puccinia striiformis f. sp. tritici]KAI7951099.1 hypothetical protein MJO29_009773 [Puccinia striiformis f. sp. tritici]
MASMVSYDKFFASLVNQRKGINNDKTSGSHWKERVMITTDDTKHDNRDNASVGDLEVTLG